ncbi:fatty acid elongase [Kwoniella mangroviensis CBS 10435]|uniref:Elongation of fatty acids protein n=1 Tax=Kwoniella mangroviensis CBS 10435 TaxID=1331196 RepID=A0A1B9IMR8_9TREE|nr:fatty acid elongase [Kwoniella mangroviensis CBS 10435]
MSPFSAWTPGPGPLYTLITSAWETLGVPKVPIQYKTWVPGSSPLSTQKEVVAAIGTYLLVIFGGRELMKKRQPFKLTGPFRFHNVYLTLGSGLLLALMLEEMQVTFISHPVPMFLKHGFFWSICNPTAFTPRLITYYMINYYIKYVELIDTVFLVLKKKPLAFLHVFHHAATAILCFTQLEGETSVQWVVITLNLLVHVIMYYYYYATAGGAKIWWKKYLTSMQITQFIIDLFIVYFASTFLFSYRFGHNQYPNLPFPVSPSTYNHFATTYTPFPTVGDCAGSEGAALFGCGLLTSYLFLFIAFYRATYKKGAAAKKAAANGKADVRGSSKSKVIVQNKRGTTVVTEVQ